MGRYIDALPPRARDRLIQAQDWALASVLQPDGGRCLVGHAEDWRELAVDPACWRRWMDGETGGMGTGPADPEHGTELAAACSPHLFAFRRAHPADLAVYRERIRRWGLASEAHIGARFDRLCARRGTAAAVRAVKARAARRFAPGFAPPMAPKPRAVTA